MLPVNFFECVSVPVTHPGNVRKINEDSFIDRPDLGLWAVADGMGGHQAGDYASRLVANFLHQVRPPRGAAQMMYEVRARLRSANRQLRNEMMLRGGDCMAGSTVVTLLFYGGHYCCLWAGDSRAYLFRNGELTQLTRDHSHVQHLIDIGVLRPEDAEKHPQANVITRAVGAADQLDLGKVHGPAYLKDTFLLCSDGLSRQVRHEEIEEILGRGSLDMAVNELLGLALQRGAPDNVTVVGVKVKRRRPTRPVMPASEDEDTPIGRARVAAAAAGAS